MASVDFSIPHLNFEGSLFKKCFTLPALKAKSEAVAFQYFYSKWPSAMLIPSDYNGKQS